MSQLGFIYDEFKKDGFKPRSEAMRISPGEDISILFHPEVPECVWFVQWQKRVLGKLVVSFWSIGFTQWILIP